jgi:hypothetical protein
LTKGRIGLWLGLLAVLFVSALSVNAQVAGRLSGSVVDQSGAAVPGATVGVYLRGGKEPLLSATTNAEGLFSFIAVRPDTYDLQVDATGFAQVMLREVRVAPIQETGLPPIKMDVRAAKTVVEVAAEAQTVQLSNTEISSTITAAQIQNLPVLGRQVTALFLSQPGVNAGSNTTSVNGLRSSFSTMTLDGINIQDNFIRTNDLDYAPMRTTIDQVAEITVATSNASSAIGGGSSYMVMSTKSGSNQFHGAVYEYNRNYKLSANDWFNNKAVPIVPRTALNLNQYGASLGGRILRDKLFFFVNPEFFRNKQQSSVLRTVLTPDAKNGIFTYVDTAGTQKKVSLATLRTFTADPTVKAMISQLPAGNSTDTGDGLNTTGYLFNAQGNEFRDQFVYKGDYYLSSRHNITGTYNYISNPTDRPTLGAFYEAKPPVTNSIRNHVLSLAWRWTPIPNLTNEVRGGFARTIGNFDVSNAYPKQLLGGLIFSNPVNTFLAQGRETNTYVIQDNANWIKGRHAIQFGFQTNLLRSTPFNDAGMVPTYTLGISTANTTGLVTADLPGVKSGDLTTANNMYANLAGIISSATQTFNVTSPTSGFVPGATMKRDFTWDTFAGYVQDNWKLRPGLTVTLGLRYEYWTPLDEKNSLYLMPQLKNNDLKATLLDPNAVLDFTGKSVGRPFYKADKNNFAPNIGIAWDPFGKGTTSIRGGYRVAYVNDNTVTTVRNNVGTSSGLQFGNTLSNQVALLTNAPVVPSPTYKVPRTLADNYAITKTSATGLPDPNLVTPFVQEWTFGVEHEVRGAIVSARYVGNHGTKLLRAVDYNQVLYNANGFLADFLRAQNNAALSQAAGGAYLGTYNPAITGSQVLTVFPLLVSGGNLTNSTIQTYLRQGEIGTLADTYMTNGWNNTIGFYTNPNVQGANTVVNDGFSSYHAFQLDVKKRIRSGLQAQFNYTFGKALSNTTGDAQTNFEPLLDNANPSLEKARSPYDLTHIFKANYYYELPYGAGKRWSGNAILNRVLGGWAVSGLWSYQSGSPLSMISGRGTLNRGGRSTNVNTASIGNLSKSALDQVTGGLWMTGNGPYFVSTGIINTDGRGTNQAGAAAFTGQVFYNPTAGNLGNLQRRMFSGPWQWSYDASVVKSVRLFESHSLDLHFDFFNLLNHPTFYVSPASGGDYGSTANANINSTSFGKITSTNYANRRVQIGAYYRF